LGGGKGPCLGSSSLEGPPTHRRLDAKGRGSEEKIDRSVSVQRLVRSSVPKGRKSYGCALEANGGWPDKEKW